MPKRVLAMFIVVALTGCQFAERGKRAAVDALASFVLASFHQMQSPLTEGTVQYSRPMTPASRGSATPAATVPLTPAPVKVCRRPASPDRLPVAHTARVALVAAAVPTRNRLIRVVVVRPNAAEIVASLKLEKRFATLNRCALQRELERMRAEMAKSIPEPPTVEIDSDTL